MSAPVLVGPVVDLSSEDEAEEGADSSEDALEPSTSAPALPLPMKLEGIPVLDNSPRQILRVRIILL